MPPTALKYNLYLKQETERGAVSAAADFRLHFKVNTRLFLHIHLG